MSQNTQGILFASTTALCWSILAILLKYALQFEDAYSIAWFRLFFAGIMLAGFIIGLKPKMLRDFKKGIPFMSIAAGFLLAANYVGYLKSIELTTASNAQIMIQTGPLMLLLIGVFYFKEKLQTIQWVGVALAFLGFVFFYWDRSLFNEGQLDTLLIGNSWIFMAAATWALYATFHKKLINKGWGPQQLNLVLYLAAGLALIPIADFPSMQSLDTPMLLLLLLLSLNTILAYGCMGEALKRIPASIVSLIITINPLVTLLLFEIMSQLDMKFVAPEPLAWQGYLGALCVVSGVGVAVSFKRAAGQRS